ncbi:MAG: Dam family site-specific DNA-(adenine-N6)-methyltransferase [Gammaproteobacteria bacterium]|nr:Dam family site-specific DNA-(adenine-N6)-methyltransferase [Gammaproteobacteria bacterium]
MSTFPVQVPPLKIQGIKTKAVPFIRDSVKWNGSGCWIEPFVGSAVVPLNLKPERALLSDANPHFIRFYQAIQKRTLTGSTVRAFLEREGTQLLHNGQEHYYRIRERFNETHDSHDFLFLNRSCFNGLVSFNKKGRFNTPFCRKQELFRQAYITKICNQVERAFDCMMGKSWDFVCVDWTDVISKAQAGDFVYCDPPYAGRYTDYFNSWDEEDAKQLEDRLKNLPCQFLYSMWSENKYRKNERLHEAFSNYEVRTFSHFYHLGSTEKLRNSMTEALVLG